jgi:hypothetical protein
MEEPAATAMSSGSTMQEDSSADFTAALSGLEGRIAERIRDQLVGISDRLGSVLVGCAKDHAKYAGQQQIEREIGRAHV